MIQFLWSEKCLYFMEMTNRIVLHTSQESTLEYLDDFQQSSIPFYSFMLIVYSFPLIQLPE